MTTTWRSMVPLTLLTAALLVATACRTEARSQGEAGGAAATSEGETAKDDAPPFVLTVRTPDLKPGEKGQAVVTITPSEHFKWNEEYPARLVFEGTPERVALGKSEFAQTGGDFETGEKKTTVSIPLEGKSAGEETVTGQAKFSVCNDTTCLIETAEVKLAVNVR